MLMFYIWNSCFHEAYSLLKKLIFNLLFTLPHLESNSITLKAREYKPESISKAFDAFLHRLLFNLDFSLHIIWNRFGLLAKVSELWTVHLI